MKARCIHILIAAAMAFPATALAEDDLDRAIEAYQRSHFAESVRLLRPAAQGGNLRAQEMLGFMHLYGATLYGTQVPRDPEQARYWLERAAAAGSSVAARGLQWVKAQAARTSTAAVAAKPPGGGLPKTKAPGSSTDSADYFPAGFPDRGRTGDGNVMNYEHD